MESAQYVGVYLFWLQVTLFTLPLHAERREQPNIVIALADDLGWADVGYHKLSGIKTPHIDQLAKEGITLTNHYVQPLCSPSRASLLTGKYPIHIGAGLNENVFAPDEVAGLPLKESLLSEKLKELGYKTALFGKWHLGLAKDEFLPTRRGFDRFYGFYSGAIDYYSHNQTAHRCHRTKKFANYLDFRDQEKCVRDRIGEYSSGIFNEEALKFIHNHKKETPFFLFMSYQNVHDPLQVPDQYSAMYPDIQDPDRKIYAGMASYLDESVWNLTQALKATDKWNDTLVVFMSDNGGNPSSAGYSWPLRGKKGTLWEGGIKSPSFLSGGYLRKSGFQSDALIHIVDWFPTLLNLAQTRRPFERMIVKTNRNTATGPGDLDENFPRMKQLKSRGFQYIPIQNLRSSLNESVMQYDTTHDENTNKASRHRAPSTEVSEFAMITGSLKSQPTRHKNRNSAIDGIDVWKAITNMNTDSPRDFIVHNINNRSYAIRKGKWKLITEIDMGWKKPPEGSPKRLKTLTNRPIDPKEFNGYLLDPKLPLIENGLFDISNDISEVNDCSKKYPDIAKDLLGIMRKFKKTMVTSQRVYTCNHDALDNAKSDKAWGPFLD